MCAGVHVCVCLKKKKVLHSPMVSHAFHFMLKMCNKISERNEEVMSVNESKPSEKHH